MTTTRVLGTQVTYLRSTCGGDCHPTERTEFFPASRDYGQTPAALLARIEADPMAELVSARTLVSVQG
jgi:hypothetical protein